MPAYVCALHVCVRGRERARVCVCVLLLPRAAAAAAAAWPFGNFIDTDTTQSVGNCCIQRFVRSPTELKFEFAPTRTLALRLSHEVRSLRTFVRSSFVVVSFAEALFIAHAACACVCVCLLVPVTEQQQRRRRRRSTSSSSIP